MKTTNGHRLIDLRQPMIETNYNYDPPYYRMNRIPRYRPSFKVVAMVFILMCVVFVLLGSALVLSIESEPDGHGSFYLQIQQEISRSGITAALGRLVGGLPTITFKYDYALVQKMGVTSDRLDYGEVAQEVLDSIDNTPNDFQRVMLTLGLYGQSLYYGTLLSLLCLAIGIGGALFALLCPKPCNGCFKYLTRSAAIFTVALKLFTIVCTLAICCEADRFRKELHIGIILLVGCVGGCGLYLGVNSDAISLNISHNKA
eukprot:1009625_1